MCDLKAAIQSAICNLKSAISAAALSAALFAAAGVGCQMSRSGTGPQFTASDEWTRSYPLAEGGDVQVVNGPGTIEIHGGGGSIVDVKAERIGRAPTDAAARELVPRIRIREEITPSTVLVQTEGLSGIVIGVDVRVNYRLTVPASTRIRARSANGEVRVSDVAGRVTLTSANGPVSGRNLSGGVEARAVNGGLSIDVAAIGQDSIDLRATNGSVELSIPANANANLSANVTNGTIDTGSLKIELMGEQTKRRLRGRLNAGGTPIEITAINGNVRILQRP
jgi:membrane-associated protease RseP (regulator of RpoE activity)